MLDIPSSSVYYSPPIGFELKTSGPPLRNGCPPIQLGYELTGGQKCVIISRVVLSGPRALLRGINETKFFIILRPSSFPK